MAEPINITKKSEPSGRSTESMPYGSAPSIPLPSNEYPGNDLPVGNSTQGRNQSVLNAVFPLNVLGLDAYDPAVTYASLMSGDEVLALGAKPALGAEAYMGSGYGVTHLTHGNAPEMKEVPVKDLNIPNPYVPDISVGKAIAGDYREEFEKKYTGTRNSFPPGSIDTGLDLSAGDGSLNPKETISRLGQWTKDTLTLGRWTD